MLNCYYNNTNHSYIKHLAKYLLLSTFRVMISILIDIKIQELIEQEICFQKKIDFRHCFRLHLSKCWEFQHGIFFNPDQDGENSVCASGLWRWKDIYKVNTLLIDYRIVSQVTAVCTTTVSFNYWIALQRNIVSLC